MAEIAVSLVVDKLVPLLEQKVNLLSGVRGEVESIITELQFIQPWLRDADEKAEKGEINDGVKVWVKKVRQVSHRMEDVIDEYILHLAQHPQQRRGFISFLQKVSCFIIKLKPRHEIASEIQDIRTSIRLMRELGVEYGFSSTLLEASSSSTSGKKNDRWDDPRVASLFIEEAEVVGIESPRDELISWLVKGTSKRAVISVVGMGGLGKTTLAKKVFDNKIVNGNFVCHAWISVSQSYTMEELLRSMIRKFYDDGKEFALGGIDAMEMESLINKLREYLQQKRYVVVFDDVWDLKFWRTTKLALPDDNNGSRVIITTRSHDVASSCKESPFDHVHELKALPPKKAWELFCKKAFHSDHGGHCPPMLLELSSAIVKTCGGLPLAIVAIGGLLSTKDESQWKKFHYSLGSELESNPHLTDIKRILFLSYLDLPCFLKPCFLYFGIFPEDYSISCIRLVRLWIAEGFIKEKKGKTLEEVAEEYLTELIHRSLVQVSLVDFDGRARSCRVHDLLREIILSKFEELGFCQLLAEEHSNFDGETRRLSIHNREHNVLKNITKSKSRSVFVFEVNKLPEPFMGTLLSNFKLMKVLDFEDAPLDCVPEEVGNLFHLQYLSVRNTKVKTLPKSIGRLQNLLTLDLKKSLVSELPVEINRLHKLRHLLAYYEDDEIDYPLSSRHGVKMQEGFGCLEALQKLYYVEANHGQGHKLMKELRELRQLRKLGIFKLRSEDGKALCKAIENMSHLESLSISSGNGDGILDLQYISSSPPRSLRRLYLRGHLGKFPNWIPKLQHLVRIRLFCSGLTEDPIKFLQALPSLLELGLYAGYDGELLYFEEGGFQKLKILKLGYLNALNSVIIEKGALPLLRELRIGPCPQLKKVPSGIQYLRNLTIVRFIEMPREFNVGMLPNEGEDYQVVEHVPNVRFLYKVEGGKNEWYKLR